MAGKFFNTSTAYTQMTTQAADVMKGLLDNPYYLFSDKKASVCTYYNLNTTMTTLDEATRGNYSEISNNSPLRFNKIKNFMIYGITRIEPNLDIGDFGLESSDITGECIVLPKTIIPYPGDYFYLDQLDKPYLFRVTAVNPNTLDTGATLYRINYSLVSSDGLKKIEPQVVKVFEFNLSLSGEMGSNMAASLIDEDTYANASELEDYATTLKDYYISMFYDNKVQSFTYNYGLTDEWREMNGDPHHLHLVNMQKVECTPFGFKVYDPYLIEFMIRNKILSGASTYIYVTQQMFLPSTFAMDYDKTIFASLEDKDLERHYGRNTGNLLYVDARQKLSLLYAFLTPYYYMEYSHLNAKFFYINIFDDPDFTNKIKNKEYTSHELKNLIVKYFNDEDITLEDLHKLKHIDYMDNKEFYYGIPFAIFCIEQQIAKNLANSNSNITGG